MSDTQVLRKMVTANMTGKKQNYEINIKYNYVCMTQ